LERKGTIKRKEDYREKDAIQRNIDNKERKGDREIKK
jgi:hypothetical protein